MGLRYMDAYEKCARYKQLQLLAYYSDITDGEKNDLIEQILNTDFDVIKNATKENTRGKITPIDVMTIDEIEKNEEEYRKIGIQAIKDGEVGAVLLAGGMGTRLGSDDPKGMFNIGIKKKKPIFDCIMSNLFDVVRSTKTCIHLFVMTSDKNHDKTVEFFEANNYFGYTKNYVHFFKQDMAPATDNEGGILLEDKHTVATSPNGNGGWYGSLCNSGLDEVIKANGIKWLNVFAVDNVLQRIADPVFIGATIKGGYVSGSKVIEKVDKDEKVGAICLEDGKPSIIEYYELNDELKNETNKDGNAAYNYGVILNYLFAVSELDKIHDNPLPLHIVEKKVTCLNEMGEVFEPEKPNARKYETLILDMIHMMENNLPFEVVREKEFAPVKNRHGVDSVDSARELLLKNGVIL